MLTVEQRLISSDCDDVNWWVDLSDALMSERLHLCGQPIVRNGGSVEHMAHPMMGFEVLLRPTQGDGSYINPSDFLALMADQNLAKRIDYYILKTVISRIDQNCVCQHDGQRIFVNLSGQSMSDDVFLAAATELILASPKAASQLCIEITETWSLANIKRVQKFMQQLSQHGCQFALDDFGSGFSSFSYLKSLPVDYIKIDGSFVLGVADNPIDFAIVRSCSEIGQMMGKTIIAEWVETDAMVQQLRRIGIDWMQGHAFGYPVPLDELI